MARTKKNSKHARIVLSNTVDWAIINKVTNTAVGVFNPHGSNLALSRVAMTLARENGIPFAKLKLIPVELLSADDLAAIGLDDAPVLTRPQAAEEETAPEA